MPVTGFFGSTFYGPPAQSSPGPSPPPTDPGVYFTTSHFNGYPAVLVRLDRIKKPALGELVIGAWLIQAPKTLVKQFRAGTSAGS